MTNPFTQAMAFRHACKTFDPAKKISDEHIHYILEAGRTSPSSFGMEAWKFLVVSNEDLKEQIRPLCWDQAQITTCSHLVIILAGIESVKPSSGEVKKRFARRPLDKEALEGYMNLYASHLSETLSSDSNIYAWTARQTYLAAANMMTAAAYEGIDSCPIEGFEKENLETLLKIDTTQHQIAMLLPFGYRINEQSTQLRLNFDTVVEFID